MNTLQFYIVENDISYQLSFAINFELKNDRNALRHRFSRVERYWNMCVDLDKLIWKYELNFGQMTWHDAMTHEDTAAYHSSCLYKTNTMSTCTKLKLYYVQIY